MTLYELTNSINIQGNIEIRIMNELDEVRRTLHCETSKLSCNVKYLRDLEDFVVTYIYTAVGCLIIEIKQRID